MSGNDDVNLENDSVNYENDFVNLADKKKEESKNRDKHLSSGKSKTQKPKDAEFNCRVCFFQGTTSAELKNHVDIKHTVTGMFKCRNCGEAFNAKPELMIHRKLEHFNAVAPCLSNLNGTCPYTSDMCWWNHEKQSSNTNPTDESIKCYFCGITFVNRGTMMIHRKKEHKMAVRNCNLFLNDKCSFTEDSCWFNHGDKETNENKNDSSDSVFRRAQVNLEPPLGNQKKKNSQQK